MKIGLIGINKYAKFLNFACDLHIYAFQQFLADEGYDSTILDYKPVYYGKFDMRNPAPSAKEKYADAVKRGVDGATLKKLKDLAEGYAGVVPERAIRFDKFEAFAKQYLSFTTEKYDSDLLEVQDPGFDCYICVTDVIWQSLDRHRFDRGFLLGSQAFDGKQKIAYAASRGASPNFSRENEQLFFEYLNDIDSISVREEDFSEYIESKSGLSAPTVIDPVLFHGKDFWGKVAAKPQEERFLVLYYVMEQATDTIDKAVEYAKLHDLTIVELSDRPLKEGRISDPDVKHIARYDVGMEEWLGYIQHAECVFTNSFHGCCFSLIFETPLFVGRRNGNKVPNFLATFKLTAQQFDRDDKIQDFTTDIDYSEAKQVLAKKRAGSREFILDALEKAEARFKADPYPDLAEYDRRRHRIRYSAHFHSGLTSEEVQLPVQQDEPGLKILNVKSGAIEFWKSDLRYLNDGLTRVDENRFKSEGRIFDGWTLRVRVDNRWFWLMADGSVAPNDRSVKAFEARKAVIADRAKVPHIPVNHISVAVFVARWKDASQGLSEKG